MDIRHGQAALPSAIADIQAGINQADAQLRQGTTMHTTELIAAHDAATNALAAAQTSGAADPLGTFTLPRRGRPWPRTPRRPPSPDLRPAAADVLPAAAGPSGTATTAPPGHGGGGIIQDPPG